MSTLFLQARRAGPLVRVGQPQDAPLVGVYRHGATALLSSRRALYLTDRGVDGPFSVLVPGFARALPRLRPGEMVQLSTETVSVPAAALIVDLRAAVRAPAPAIPAAVPWARTEALLQPVLRRALRREGAGSIALQALACWYGWHAAPISALGQRFLQQVAPLLRATITADAAAIAPVGQRLLGLGGGLTPAGDDLLAGYVAALALIRDDPILPQRQSRPLARAILSRRGERTHPLSAALLWAAARGAVSGPLARMLERLLAGDAPTGEEIAALSAIGSSSGFDGLAGVLLALEGCSRRAEAGRAGNSGSE
ncbi:MAG: DUF2877 domain-containing protein [Candidatus Promineifilaceae bacterium]|nr:DUF2877 domain-containing protein [Candidatus Promineifilaceae bacterium]